MPDAPLSIFLSYSRRDEDLRERLESHLALLKREGRIATWNDRKIRGGEAWEERISGHLEAADVVLLLVSADFLASDYCYRTEMRRALERHGEGSARVVPIVLRPCDWQSASFGKLQALPRDAQPVVSWEDQDAAWTNVAKGLRELVGELCESRAGQPVLEPEPLYPNERIRRWSRKLRDAYQRLEEETVAGGDVAIVKAEIADLRRRLREGGLEAGDYLAGGHLRLIDLIGSGGFATVWKAYDRPSRIPVAVKVLHVRYARDASRCERFFRGAYEMAQLRHPGIVRVIKERGRDGRFHYFVMELMDDGDLHRAVLAGRFPEISERLRLVGEVGEALVHAHERGVIHRDVKPHNVLIDAAGSARLTDFDLVRTVDSVARTRTDTALGTLGYAAPEVLSNAKGAGVAADVYGLGMTAVFAVYGKELPLTVVRDAPKFAHQLEVGEAVRNVLARAVAFEQEVRFANVEEFGRALQESLIAPAGAARLYVDKSRGNRWNTELSVSGPERPREDRQKSSLWMELWTDLGNFDDPLVRYVLIADPLGGDMDLSCLGLLPWSLVVDFDFKSEESGLYCDASPVLETSRALYAFSLEPDLPDFDRDTAWVMARGWTREDESVPKYDSWKIKHRAVLRKVFRQFFHAVAPNGICVVVLTNRSQTSDPDYDERLFLTIDIIAETCEARARIYQVGGKSLRYTQPVRHVPLTARDVVEQIRDTYGTYGPHKILSMPAVGGGLKPIPINTLRLLEEGFDVLHSKIHDDVDNVHNESLSPFWRGSPPNWHDLNAAKDVPRRVQRKLIEKLELHLKEYRNYTVQLFHMPGAGGTTLALRAAWDLHQRYPTVILKYRTRAMATHLEWLFYTLQRPILLVADASVLSDHAREALYRELAGKNCRVVTLYVRRSVKTDPYSGQLFDRLDRRESKKFLEIFSGLTEDAGRQEEIQRITERPELERFRFPFMYGLVTFGKEFSNVDRFVHIHLAGAPKCVRKTVEFLAVITRFSKTGLHELLALRLLGATDTYQMSLEDLMGVGPCRMVVRDNCRFKLMHPILAEEVLKTVRLSANEFETGSRDELWLDNLPDLATDFIQELVRVGGNASDEVLGLFSQLFIRQEPQVLEDSESQNRFAEIIEMLDEKNPLLGHKVLEELRNSCPNDARFLNHLGRHLIYRVGRNYEEAERCLKQAALLSPADHVHHHTLGMVRRLWIKSMIRGLKNPSPEAILDRIDEKYGDTIEALTYGRELNREDHYSHIFDGINEKYGGTVDLSVSDSKPHRHAEYGYIISIIQLILLVAEEMRRAAGVEDLAVLQESSRSAAAWIDENIPQAERLLEAAKRLSGHLEFREDDYITRCTADLKRLYGEHDQVIAAWELFLRRGTSSPQARRSLALAYLARRERNWSLVSEGECERIVFLMEENLSRGNPRPKDYWFWFQAYRQTDRFSYDDALCRLDLWKERSELALPHYYIYVLNFLLWLLRDDELSAEFKEAREQAGSLAVGHRFRSFEWLGKDSVRCPLVSEDLLTWDARKRFWHDTTSLRRVNGIVFDMPGPQSGRIQIEGSVDAFFVPGKQFFRYSFENKKVNFFLGFSYNGLRAWQVEEGWVEEGYRHHALPAPMDREKLARSFLGANPAFEQYAPQTVASARRSLVLERIRDFSIDYIQAAVLQDSQVELSDIAGKIESIYNFSTNRAELGFDSIEGLLVSFQGVQIDDSSGRRLVTNSESRRDPGTSSGG